MIDAWLQAPKIDFEKKYNQNQIGNLITKQWENSEAYLQANVCLIGVNDSRLNTDNKGTELGADAIRKSFYTLYADFPLQIHDMGNIDAGYATTDTIAALTDVIETVMQNDAIPIILGASQAFTYAQFKAYEKKEQIINIAICDATIDYEANESLNNNNYLHQILTHNPNYTFNFVHLAHQTYLTQPHLLQQLHYLGFETLRLGDLQDDIKECEPLLRDADVFSMDMKSIRISDSPAHAEASPHGLYGEQACAIARYAGLSQKVSTFGLYEYNPQYDHHNQGSQLAAHIIWHFLQGCTLRNNDHPQHNEKNYLKYIVNYKDHDHEIVFWKNKQNDRWWIQLPNTENKIYIQQKFIPCSYKDYLIASNDEIPPRWLKAIERLY